MASLGSLTLAVDALQDDAANLFKAYENDDDVADLKTRAVDIRDKAQSLVDAFDGIREGLNLL